MTNCKLTEKPMTDTVLKQLIRRMAEAEGQELLETAAMLARDEGFCVPEDLNARCMASIAEAAAPAAPQKGRPGRKVFRYLASAVLAASLMLITAFATVEEVRLGTWQLLAKVRDDVTYYTVYPYRHWSVAAKANPTDTVEDTILGYSLPEEPEGIHISVRETFANLVRALYGTGAEAIELRVLRLGGVVSPPETDLTDAVPVTIHGCQGQLVTLAADPEQGRPAEQTLLFWEDGSRNCRISLSGPADKTDTLLDMALEVQPVDQSRPPVALGYQLPLPPEGFELANARRVANSVSLRWQVMGDDYAFLDVEVTCGDVALPGSLPQSQMEEVTVGDHPGQLLSGTLPTVDGSTLHFTELFWCDTHRGAMFSLSSRGLGEEEILDYARAIQYVGE